MPGTRSSVRLADQSSPSSENTNGTKRKAESSPTSANTKRGRKDTEKEQKTIEETFAQDQDKDEPKDIEMKEAGSAGEGNNPKPDKQEEAKVENGHKSTNGSSENSHDGGPSCWFWLDNAKDYKTEAAPLNEAKTFAPGDSFKGENREGESKSDPEKALKDSRGGPGLNAIDDKKSTDGPEGLPPQADVHANKGTKPASTTQDSAVETSKARADAQPSNILEKGIIYFFTRGRVGVDDPDNVQDLQRSYFVLRPLPPGAKLGDGVVEDMKNNRLLALPKKVWPKTGQDKFMVFVEKAKASMVDLKENFFQGSEYNTKTTGVRQTPPITPIGEGVYAITSVGNRNETHLAYMLTIPREPGEMQEDVGIRSKGSFVLSLKNPDVKGPANATLPQTADFPKDVMDDFRGRGWMPAEPKHLDYANAQILLIGEGTDSSHALEATAKDEKSDEKETPQEEIEKLEHEDELRVEHLKGDDTVFDDLGLSHKEYPSVPTTW